MNIEVLKRVLSPINRRIKLLCTRGLVRRSDAAGDVQRLQVELHKGELLDDIDDVERYGLTSNPHDGAETVTLSLSGRRSHTIVVQVGDRRYRLKGLAKGEVALYDDQAQTVHIRRDGIYITSAQQLVVDTLQALFTGDVAIDGELYVVGDISSDANVLDVTGSIQAMRDIYNAHSPGAPEHPPGDMI